jgi:hypothetical protein
MVHTYNPNYLGSGDGGLWFKTNPSQKVPEILSQPIRAGCDGMHLSSQLWGGINRRMVVQTGLGIK